MSAGCSQLPCPPLPYGLYPSCPYMRALECLLSGFSHVQLFVTPWTLAHQAPLSMGFSSQEYWKGLPFPSPRGSSPPRG